MLKVSQPCSKDGDQRRLIMTCCISHVSHISYDKIALISDST